MEVPFPLAPNGRGLFESPSWDLFTGLPRNSFVESLRGTFPDSIAPHTSPISEWANRSLLQASFPVNCFSLSLFQAPSAAAVNAANGFTPAALQAENIPLMSCHFSASQNCPRLTFPVFAGPLRLCSFYGSNRGRETLTLSFHPFCGW